MEIHKARIKYNIMGCTTVSAKGKVQRSTAIEIIDESEYNKNPTCSSYVNLVSNGKKYRLHYRKLGCSQMTCSKKESDFKL